MIKILGFARNKVHALSSRSCVAGVLSYVQMRPESNLFGRDGKKVSNTRKPCVKRGGGGGLLMLGAVLQLRRWMASRIPLSTWIQNLAISLDLDVDGAFSMIMILP